MRLQLRITKAPDGTPPSLLAQPLDASGGSLGRGPDNTWVLPDPERILSSRHCEFLFEQGRYQLLDLSTNGTFVNGAPEPLGKGTATPVQHGDVVEVGDYRFAIELPDAAQAPAPSPFAGEGAESAPPPASEQGFGDPFASDPFPDESAQVFPDSEVDPLKALDGLSANGAGAAAPPWPGSTDDLGLGGEPRGVSDGGQGGSPFGEADPWPEQPSWPASNLGEGVVADDAIAWPETQPENLIPDDWLDDGAEPAPKKEPPVAKRPEPVAPMPPMESEAPRPTNPRPRPGGVNASVQPNPVDTPNPTASTPGAGPSNAAPPGPGSDALVEAMGLDPGRLSAEARADLYPLVGRLVREVVSGMMQVLRSRASIKNEFRMSITTIQPVENNPLKFSADVDEALENIFVRRSSAYKPPLEAVHEGFQEIAEHQLAMIAGMRSAFERMLQGFDPEQLEPRFNKQQKPNPLSPLQNGRYWRQYQAYYQGLNDNIERSFQQVFGDEFVQAYQEQLHQLSASRRR